MGGGCLDNLWRIQSCNSTNHKPVDCAWWRCLVSKSDWLRADCQFDSIFGRPWCWFCKPEILDRVKARNAARIVCFRSNGIIIVSRRHRHRIVRDFGLSQRQSTRRVRVMRSRRGTKASWIFWSYILRLRCFQFHSRVQLSWIIAWHRARLSLV